MNIKSLKAKLLNISHEKKISFQDLLNRFGSEQFLSRLSLSPYANLIVFKGGTLLTYLISTERRTQDLDFQATSLAINIDKIISLVNEIKNIEMDDGIIWGTSKGHTLEHPMMDYPGFRIKCPFMLGKARGLVRMDFGIGEVFQPKKMHLEKIRYKGEPLMGQDLDLLAYPAEMIFSEKLHIAQSRGAANTRMKDYYDMFKLIESHVMDTLLLKSAIEDTFRKRQADVQTNISFDKKGYDQLQGYWDSFLRKMQPGDVPEDLKDVIGLINNKLREIYGIK